jgi:predicted glutamine amidotransferase
MTAPATGPDDDGVPPTATEEATAVCRWLAYSGSPIRLDELLYNTDHSLIDQSLHARLGAQTTNGDGFGVGWYAPGAVRPALFRGTGPAWNDLNLRELAGTVAAPMFLAHVRASTGSAVQQTNCHPFRHGRWLWIHNGLIRDFDTMRRDLTVAVHPRFFPDISGTTDSELMFYLALTFGLRRDPVLAVQRMAGFVEAVGRRHGVRHPLQMSVATSNGERLWAFRYSSERESRSLFFSTAVSTLREMYPDNENLRRLAPQARIVVSEPLGDLVGAWQPVPESSWAAVHGGAGELGGFEPCLPRGYAIAASGRPVRV